MFDTAPSQAVVIAGGLGTRLGVLGAARPKILQPAGGRPFLDHLVELLLDNGFRRVHFALGHLADQVVDHLRTGWPDLPYTFSVEDRREGTGGALLAGREYLDDVFMSLFGDTFLPIDYRAFAASANSGDMATMAVTDADCGVTPNVSLVGDRVVRYRKDGGLDWVDTGAAVLRREALDLIADLPRPVDLGTLLTGLAAQGRLGGWRTHVAFADIGTPERLGTFADSRGGG
jgi:NDP-sugar pyrophosphorylase family protein